jgi:hypothetical protein
MDKPAFISLVFTFHNIVIGAFLLLLESDCDVKTVCTNQSSHPSHSTMLSPQRSYCNGAHGIPA